jgi:hypothetical protein
MTTHPGILLLVNSVSPIRSKLRRISVPGNGCGCLATASSVLRLKQTPIRIDRSCDSRPAARPALCDAQGRDLHSKALADPKSALLSEFNRNRDRSPVKATEVPARPVYLIGSSCRQV